MDWFRRRSLSLRAMLALTALSTTLCLGCKAWEPILGCADETATSHAVLTSASDPAPAQDVGLATVSVGHLEQHRVDFSCGCISCHGGTAPQVATAPESSSRAVTPLRSHVPPLLL